MTKHADAIVFPKPNHVDLWSIDVPDPGPDEVAVRTVFSGVSQGTERWMLLGRYDRMAEQIAANYPCFPGYQAAGMVDMIGADVTELRPGDRGFLVGTRLADAALKKRGTAGHVSYLVAPRSQVARLGPDADLAAASLFVMAAVGRHGVRLTNIQAGELVVVIGQGMIGQMSAQAARQRGARVITADTIDLRVALSTQYSADRAVHVTHEQLAEVVRSEAADGADVVIDTTGNSSLFSHWLDLVRREGRICLQGYYPDPVVIDFHAAHLKRVTVTFPCAWDRERDQDLADDISAHRLNIAPLITHRIPYHAAREVYQMVVERPHESLGLVLTWDVP